MADLIDPEACPGKLLAKFLGCSDRQIRILHSEGVLEQTKRGRYDIAAAADAYRRNEKRSSKSTALHEERAGLIAAQRRAKELDNAEREKSLLPAEDTQYAVSKAMVELVGMLKAHPGHMGPVLAPISDPDEIKQILSEEVNAIRTATAGRLAMLGAGVADVGDTAPAARPKPRSVGGRKKKVTRRKR